MERIPWFIAPVSSIEQKFFDVELTYSAACAAAGTDGVAMLVATRRPAIVTPLGMLTNVVVRDAEGLVTSPEYAGVCEVCSEPVRSRNDGCVSTSTPCAVTDENHSWDAAVLG